MIVENYFYSKGRGWVITTMAELPQFTKGATLRFDDGTTMPVLGIEDFRRPWRLGEVIGLLVGEAAEPVKGSRFEVER